MAARVTTEEYLRRARAVHGDRYSYDKVVYKSSHAKIVIGCKIHGDFEQDPSNHLKGTNCPYCSNRVPYTSTTFAEKATKVHGDSYSYEKVEIKNNRSVVEIFCKNHQGYFKQLAADHLSGKGCAECSRVKAAITRTYTTEEFIEKAERVHKLKYDYSLVAYKHGRSLVEIICKDHGIFKQMPENHLLGNGCPSCANSGYKTTKPGSFYILKCENITKIGITNRSASERIKKINKSSRKIFEVLFEVRFSDGWVANHIETDLLRKLSNTYDNVLSVYDGSTESFTDVDINELLSDTVKLCGKYLPKY